ncbi:hypothetical protein [Mycoplasmoides pneumoniae]
MKQTVKFASFVDQLLVNLAHLQKQLNHLQPDLGTYSFQCFTTLNDVGKTPQNFIAVLKQHSNLLGCETNAVLTWWEAVEYLLLEENKDVMTVVKTLVKHTEKLIQTKAITLGHKRVWDLLYYFCKSFLQLVNRTKRQYKQLDGVLVELYERLCQTRAQFGKAQFLGKRSVGQTTPALCLTYLFLQSFIYACQS